MTTIFSGSLSYAGAAPGFVTATFDTPAIRGLIGLTALSYFGNYPGQQLILRCFSGAGGTGSALGDPVSSTVNSSSVVTAQPAFTGSIPAGTNSMTLFFGNVVSLPSGVTVRIDDTIINIASILSEDVAALQAQLTAIDACCSTTLSDAAAILAAVRRTFP